MASIAGFDGRRGELPARHRAVEARLAAAAPQQGRAVLRRPVPADRGPVPAGAGVRQARRAHRPRHRATSPARSRSAASSREHRQLRPASRSARPGTASYFFGADANGRDVAVRLLYGGRNSLEIGVVATLITMILALILGMLAGYFRGACGRGHLPRLRPHLGLSGGAARGSRSGTVLADRRDRPAPRHVPAGAGGRHRGRLHPVRGQADPRPGAAAARARVRRRRPPAGPQRTGGSCSREILPNLASTIVVFIPLILANAILLEAGLSLPRRRRAAAEPVVGHDDLRRDRARFPAAFHNVLVPGIMLVLCVLSINVFGDGLRDALDPRAKVRIAH